MGLGKKRVKPLLQTMILPQQSHIPTYIFFFRKTSVINFVIIIISRFACMDPASLTIVPDIKLPTVDGRQLSPENCVSSNKEVNKN